MNKSEKISFVRFNFVFGVKKKKKAKAFDMIRTSYISTSRTLNASDLPVQMPLAVCLCK